MSLPGLQGPRTMLAWRRTALTAWAVAALGVHVAADSGRTPSVVAAAGLVAVALGVSVAALVRRPGLARRAPSAAPWVLGAVAAVVALGAALSAWGLHG